MMALLAYDRHNLSTYERVRIEYGYDTPPDEIVTAIRQACQEPLSEKEGAPWLAIPAKCIFWLKCKTNEDDDTKEPSYSTVLLDPVQYSQRLLDLNGEVIKDHYTNMYEAAFWSVLTGGEDTAEPPLDSDIESTKDATTTSCCFFKE